MRPPGGTSSKESGFLFLPEFRTVVIAGLNPLLPGHVLVIVSDAPALEADEFRCAPVWHWVRECAEFAYLPSPVIPILVSLPRPVAA